MTMIGLFTGAPQVATATAATDKKTAEGFGGALQNVLSMLSGNPGQAKPGALSDTTADGSALAAAALPALSLEEPVAETLPWLEATEASTEGQAPVAETVPPLGLSTSGTLPPVGSSPSPAPTEGLPGAHESTPLVEADPLVVPGLTVETPPRDSAPPVETTKTPAVTQDVVPPQRETPLGTGAAPVVATAGLRAAESTPAPDRRSPVAASPIDGVAATTAATPILGGSTPAPVDALATAGTAPSDDAETSLPGVRPAGVSTASAASTGGPSTTTVPGPTSQSGAVTSSAASIDAATPVKDVGPAATPANRESVSPPVPQPVAAPIGAPMPSGISAPAASPAVAVPEASAPFATQLAKPIFSLASVGAGQHTMTISVTPDSLGPVTVRAHVGAEGVRVELFAPTELGRDAIRAILPELRRDLAGAGLGGNLSLSSEDGPSEQFGAGEGNGSRGDTARASARESGQNAESAPETGTRRPTVFGTTSTIDVLA